MRDGLGMPGHHHYGERAGVSYLYAIYIRWISNVTVLMNILKRLRGVEPDVEPVRYLVTEGAYAPEDLPLRDGPLRFAVMSSDGASSESWSVTVTNLGDVYIVCREVNLDIKVRLARIRTAKDRLSWDMAGGQCRVRPAVAGTPALQG